jgi:hypothetical protein
MEWLMMSGLGFGYAGVFQAALLVSMFWVAASKPERIRSSFQFRCAGYILVVGLLMPVVLLFLGPTIGETPGRANESGPYLYFMAASLIATPVAALMAIDAVIPRD